MIASYPDLRQQIMNKNRGRKNEVGVCESPYLWAYMPLGFDRDIQVYLNSSKQTVCEIHPDNSMEIDIHGWHTQLSGKIIGEITGGQCWSSKGTLWHQGMPVDGLIRYDSSRHFIQNPKYVAINNKAFELMEQVTFADLPARERLMKEPGMWDPSPAITDKVKAYARGEIVKDQLGARDILTICQIKEPIIWRLFEEAI